MTSEKTPIEFAIEKRNAGIIQLLAQNEKIEINQFSTISDLNEDQEITALCTAAESRNSEIDKVLLTSKNIDCNLQCKYKKYINKPYSQKTKEKYKEEEEEEEYQPDEETSEKVALHISIENSDLDLIQILLNNENTDINIPYKYTHNQDKYIVKTSLIIAIEKEQIEIVKFLFSSKDIEIQPRIMKNVNYIDNWITEIWSEEIAQSIAVQTGNANIVLFFN